MSAGLDPDTVGIAGPTAGLDELDRDGLRMRFAELYGGPPPGRIGASLLRRAIAYRIQETRQDGLKPILRRRLAKLARELKETGVVNIAGRPLVKPGTRLIREWRGESHAVTVLDDGFLYRNARYRSLSEIARAITGTRWSGPAFFGLKRSK